MLKTRRGLTAASSPGRVLLLARNNKVPQLFSATHRGTFFTDALYVFATDRWDLYAVVQCTLHEVWARKYSGALKQDLRYSPSDCFETFAFPEGLWQTADPALAAIGERYHEHRRSLMLLLWLGLTDIYNLFHARDLTPAKVAKVSKKSPEETARGYEALLELRRLHVELDLAIRDAYGWQNLPLDHDFYEVETLAENDRVRYTISPVARKEVLRRLLALNHARAAEEKAKEKPAKTKRGKKALSHEDQPVMFVRGRLMRMAKQYRSGARVPIYLTELIEKLPSDTAERVKRAKDKHNVRIREALRHETGLKLTRGASESTSASSTTVPIRKSFRGVPAILEAASTSRMNIDSPC